MAEIIKWFNSNSGFSMFLLTLVYVFATILICIFNYRSAKATKDQITESRRQFIEQSRANIIPKIITLRGTMVCLSFHNIGKDIANEVVINISETWLKKLDQTNEYNAVKLRKLKETPLFLTVDQEIVYDLCDPKDGKQDFQKLGEVNFEVDIRYQSDGNNYNKNFVIPFSSYSYMLDTSDYVTISNRKIKEMKQLEKELKYMRRSIDNLGRKQ